jgi:hypothetical protein
MIRTIQEIIDKWKVRRLLKKSGCNSLAQYNRMHDPLINRRANTITYFYHGYPYVVRIPYSLYTGDWHDGIESLTRWCEKHCKEKWRHDWHRVYCTLLNGTISEITDDLNDMGGSDFMYFAFLCQKDYNWFILSHNLND